MAPVIRSPIKIIGGKGVLRGRILPYFPDHYTYVEPFAGGASLFFAKAPVELEVLNDLDPRITTLFRVIMDPKRLPLLIEQLMLTPYSRKERLFSKDDWQKETDEVVRARMFFVNCRQSLGGMIDRTSWGLVKNTSVRGMAQPISAYIKAIKELPRVAKRMENAIIAQEPYEKILQQYDEEETLFYLDPPYPQDTRRDGWYDFEMTNEEHEALAERILKLKGYAILSGYQTDIYKNLEKAGWKLIKFDRSCNAAARTSHTKLMGDGVIKVTQARIECLWLNPRTVSAL